MRFRGYTFCLRQFGTGLKIHRKLKNGGSKVARVDHIDSKAICERYSDQVASVSGLMESAARRSQEESLDRRSQFEDLISILRFILENKNRRLVPVGSHASTLAGPSSDLDLVFMPYNSESQCNEFEAKFSSQKFREQYMRIVRDQVGKSPLLDLKTAVCLSKARVPIIKLQSKTGIDVDIQFNNIAPIRSSLFLRACLEYDERVRMLIVWLHRSFEKEGLKDSRHNLFSSYVINMLVVHFLRQGTVPLLPDFTQSCPILKPSATWPQCAELLQKNNNFSSVSPLQLARSTVSAGELLIAMIEYFTRLDLHTMAIDANGQLKPRKSSGDDSDSKLYLTDPFHSATRSRSTTPNGASLLQQHFAAVYSEVSTGSFNSIVGLLRN